MEEEHAEEQDEAPEEEEQQQAALPHSSSGISAVNGPQPLLGGSPRGSSPRGRSPRGDSPQGGSPRANSSSNRGFQPPEAPDLELDPEAGHSLEDALLKQMDMQKKLHEQLEVRMNDAHEWRGSSEFGGVPSECHLLDESSCGKICCPCVRLSFVRISASRWMLIS